jgi:hypothetical protein
MGSLRCKKKRGEKVLVNIMSITFLNDFAKMKNVEKKLKTLDKNLINF